MTPEDVQAAIDREARSPAHWREIAGRPVDSARFFHPESWASDGQPTAQDIARAISAALAQDREARSREYRRALHRFEMLACGVCAIVLCVLQPWFLIPVALFGLFAMALSENRVASFIGRWSWKALGYGLVLGALWLWFH